MAAVPERDGPGTTLPTDVYLVAALRRGDEAVFETVVRAWSPTMLRVARAYVSTAEVADEVVQETWIAVLRGLDGFEGRSALRTWALRICANQARATGAREKRSTPAGLLSTEYVERESDRFEPNGPFRGHWRTGQEPSRWDPQARLSEAEFHEVILAGLRTLPTVHAQVLALRDVHQLSTDEVAAVLEMTPGHVRVALHRGRAAIRRLLSVEPADMEGR